LPQVTPPPNAPRAPVRRIDRSEVL
jgi:hypothetical protein